MVEQRKLKKDIPRATPKPISAYINPWCVDELLCLSAILIKIIIPTSASNKNIDKMKYAINTPDFFQEHAPRIKSKVI